MKKMSIPHITLLAVGLVAAVFSANFFGAHAFIAAPRNVPRVVPICSSQAVVEESTTTAPLKVEKAPPGERENEKFQCDASVDFWRNFESQGNEKNLNRIRELIATNTASRGNQATAYWSSQVLRTAYFTATAVMGTVASDLHERFIASRNTKKSPNENAGQTFLAVQSGSMTSNLLQSDVPSRLIFEALKSYEQDWKYVESGLLNFPWDGFAVTSRDSDRLRLQTNHKQLNPLFAFSETVRVMRESVGIFSRRTKYQGSPSGEVWMKQPPKTTTVQYPDYYLNDFHYQTDGWLSSDSAATYEASTETLFLGRQDAMQRQTLIPLLKHFRNTPPSNLLEVACGTGRFATFARDNFPKADVVLTDLSPFYLEKARDNDKYWRSYRGAQALKEKNPGSSSDTKPEPATFVQANAESLPFPDESFDAVTCIYLFHELPHEARENAAREMARVVKPGGMVVLSDSIQLGDRPPLDKAMGNFSRLNEPHYQDFMVTPLAPLFERHGLTCSEKYVSSSTKTLSFTKQSDP